MGRSGAREVKISFAAQSLTHLGGLFLLHRFVQRLGLRSLLADRVCFAQRNKPLDHQRSAVGPDPARAARSALRVGTGVRKPSGAGSAA